jgi:ribosomal protein S18 acetylase RimI-like enzyme
VVESRPFEAESDLRLMQELCAETWRRQGALAPIHAGDVAWWMYQRPNRLSEASVRLWLEDGACLAFAWNWLRNSHVDCLVHPDHTELLADVLDAVGDASVYAQESDEAKVAGLRERGFAPTEGEIYNHMIRSLEDDLPEPRMPEGYRIRTVEPDDLERRVEVHRAAFAPSRVVPESYARLQQEWPYRRDLDHVVEAPDGTFAAFCLAWLDEENGAGLLEPVGTHPDHRRRGLASAATSAALRSLRAAGARTVVINSVDPSPAETVYEGIGFRTVTRHVPFGKNPSSAVV